MKNKNIILYKNGSIKINDSLRKIEDKKEIELILIEDIPFNSFIYLNYNNIMKGTKFIVKYLTAVYQYDYNDDEFEYGDKIKEYYREFEDAESFYRFIKMIHRTEYANYVLNSDTTILEVLDVISLNIKIYNKSEYIYTYNHNLKPTKKYLFNTCLPTMMSELNNSILSSDKYHTFYNNIYIDPISNSWSVNKLKSMDQLVGYNLPYIDNISFLNYDDYKIMKKVKDIGAQYNACVDPYSEIKNMKIDYITEDEVYDHEIYTSFYCGLNSTAYILEFFNYLKYIKMVNNIILDTLYNIGNLSSVVGYYVHYKDKEYPKKYVTNYVDNPIQEIIKSLKGD